MKLLLTIISLLFIGCGGAVEVSDAPLDDGFIYDAPVTCNPSEWTVDVENQEYYYGGECGWSVGVQLIASVCAPDSSGCSERVVADCEQCRALRYRAIEPLADGEYVNRYRLEAQGVNIRGGRLCYAEVCFDVQ